MKTTNRIILYVPVGGSLIENLQLASDQLPQEIWGIGSFISSVKNKEEEVRKSEVQRLAEGLNEAIKIFGKGINRTVVHNKTIWKLDATNPNSFNSTASGEIQSITKFIELEMLPEQRLSIRLLATKTHLSWVSAILIEQLLEYQFKSKINNIQIKVLEDISISEQFSFRQEGFKSLARCFTDDKGKAERVINVTSGHKGLIPLLSVIAQIISARIIYNFEFSKKNESGPLMQIPNINIHLIWHILEDLSLLMNKLNHAKRKDVIIEFSKAEQKTIEDELITNKIAQWRGNKMTLTPFGELLYNLHETRMPMASGVIGHFIEFKIFECLIRAPYEDYIDIKHSVWKSKVEIDIVQENEKDWIWTEVKSYGRIANAFPKEKRENQYDFGASLKKQLSKVCNEKNGTPIAYHLFIHKRNFLRIDSSEILSSIQKIKALLLQYNIPDLLVFYVDIDLTLKDLIKRTANPIGDKVMTRKFTKDEALYLKKKDGNNIYDQYECIKLFNYAQNLNT